MFKAVIAEVVITTNLTDGSSKTKTEIEKIGNAFFGTLEMTFKS